MNTIIELLANGLQLVGAILELPGAILLDISNLLHRWVNKRKEKKDNGE